MSGGDQLSFFERPILNSPYAYPGRHWELDADGQPTGRLVEARREARFITPVPRPKKRRHAKTQQRLIFDEGAGVSDARQQYDPTPIINELRRRVDQWRAIASPSHWGVTPETARLLQHWRHHDFAGIRPFFCQVQAVETVIWLTEVAPNERAGKGFLDHLANASEDANPGPARPALKLATGAGKTTVMAMLIAWQTVNAVRRPQSPSSPRPSRPARPSRCTPSAPRGTRWRSASRAWPATASSCPRNAWSPGSPTTPHWS
jgi:type III restriction enzyme